MERWGILPYGTVVLSILPPSLVGDTNTAGGATREAKLAHTKFRLRVVEYTDCFYEVVVVLLTCS